MMEELTGAARFDCLHAIELFEQAWFRGEKPDIAEFLPNDDAWRHALLVELVHIDLELRHKAGETIGLDHYLARFPDLSADEPALQSLGKGLADPGDTQLNPHKQSPLRFPGAEPGFAAGVNGTANDARPSTARFRILRPYARGGLGQVSLAVDEELHREVALKEIQPRHADDAVSRERFLVEAEITGGLEHPGIVPVYGLGRYADGRPYYAMRFIRGESLKTALAAYHKPDNPNRRDRRARQLELRQLLGRFIDVCNAVEYAHSRGVIHRDLKPSNIMLGKYGETLVVDWGLAKYVGGAELASPIEAMPPICSLSSSGQTQPGSAIGTPAYMSPEQAAGRLDELGPATDIYGLGATLYHLLTGQPPLEGADAAAIHEKVSRGDFPPPRARNAEVPRALEAVSLKAMAMRPADRYASAKSLADELERWLADEPVAACPESWTARLSRWGRRHRALVGTAVALLFTSLVATTIAAFVVSSERERTLRADQQAELNRRAAAAADQQAEINRRAAADVADLLQQLFRSADPIGYEGFGMRDGKQRAADVTARQLLDAAAKEVSLRLSDSPEVQSALFETMGNSYRGLADYATAERFLLDSLEIRRRLFGDEHVAVAASLFSLGILRQDTGKYDEAERLYREALDLQVRLIGPGDLAVSRTEFQLAWILSQQPYAEVQNRERNEEAEKFIRDALAIRREKLGKNHHDVGVMLATLAGIRMARVPDLGPAAEKDAQALLIEAFQILDRPENRSDIGSATAYFIKGESLRSMRKFKEAVEAHQKVVEISRRQLGDAHPMYALMLATLAGTQRQAGDLDGAYKSITEVLGIARKSAMRSQPGILDIFIQFGDGMRDARNFAEAEALYREAITYGQEADSVATAPLVARARARLDELAKQQPPSHPAAEAPASP